MKFQWLPKLNKQISSKVPSPTLQERRLRRVHVSLRLAPSNTVTRKIFLQSASHFARKKLTQ
jgi:hypothetical protein